MSDVTQIAAIAQAKAQQLGIQKFDVSGSAVDEASVQVDQGEPKQVKASNRSSVMVRVWNEVNTVGVASTSELDELGLELALKTAQEASVFGPKEHGPDFSPSATQPVHNPPIEQAPPSEIATLIEKLIDTEAKLLDAHPAIVGVPYNGLAQREAQRFYLNSDGALRQEARSSTSVYLYSKTEAEGKRPRSAGAYRVSYDLARLDLEGCWQEAAQKPSAILTIKKLPAVNIGLSLRQKLS